jgi:hypothetical protein
VKRVTGPNSGAGHTSAIISLENGINYSLRVIKPILDGKASTVEVKSGAERQWSVAVQANSEATVFYSGCTSWFIKTDKNGKRWNATIYPFSQANFWRRSLFPVWRDFEFSVSNPGAPIAPCWPDKMLRIQGPLARKSQWSLVKTAATFSVLVFVIALLYERHHGQSLLARVWRPLQESPAWQSLKNLIPAESLE